MDQPAESVIGALIFLFGFILIFTTSTLYHFFKDPLTKYRLKQADHISIYYMIAGSYTPFILIYFKTDMGLKLLMAIWGLTFIGTIFKIFTTGRFQKLSTAIYVLMGAAVLLVSNSFFPLLPKLVRNLIIYGGIYYFIGVLFYLRKSWKYHHPVWHLFVLAGALMHWWALWYSLG